MTKHKLFNLYCKLLFMLALAKARLTARRIPLMANILLTNQCNLKCFYCYVDTEYKRPQDIKLEKLFKLIDTLHKRGTRLVVLLGGEPLLYNRIGDTIRYVKKKRMVCEVIINGYFIERHIDDLVLCDSVCVSLDGDEKTHDLNRGGDSYKQAVAAIKLLQQRGIPVRIKAVLTKNNFDSLEYLCLYARENGLLLTASIPAIYDKREYMQKDSWLGEDKKRIFFNNLISLKKKGFPIGYSFTALKYILNWPYEEDFIVRRDRSNHTEQFELLRCKRKDNSFYIDADGSMYPCANQWGRGGKNVLSDGFDAAWADMANCDCYACGSLPDIDLTYLFNCNLENLLNTIKFYGRG